MDGWIRTPRLLCLCPQSLFKCFLVFQRWPFFAFALRMAFWAIVFCEDAVTLCVEDDEGLDAVEREVHLEVVVVVVVSGGGIELGCWD